MSAANSNDPMIINPEATDEALLDAIQARIVNIYTVACEDDETHASMYERLSNEASDLLEAYRDRHREPPTPEQVAVFERSRAA